jgi:putative queuosine salvage protein
MPEEATNVCDRVRNACAWVAGRGRSVSVEEEAVAAYAETLPLVIDPPEPDPATEIVDGDVELRAAFVICLDAINFGSGWWPTIRKRPGHSGYFTIAAGVAERFRRGGAWSAAELTEIAAADIAEVVGQDPDHPLMADFAVSLRDVGEHVMTEHGGRFIGVLESARGSAPALADLLAQWRAFTDTSIYDGRPVPFFKRAQLVPADLNRIGVASLRSEDRLTAFADNLVPHVLRLDGILRLDPALAEAIDAGELLAHGSAEEVELRACAVHTIELLAAATDRLSPAEIDYVLWNRGQQPPYKAVPRPRSRNTAY